MSVTEIATAVISYLAPYLMEMAKSAANKAGEAAWQKATQLHQFLSARFHKEDQYFQQTLHQFEENPQTRQRAFQELLEEILQKDPQFMKELLELLPTKEQSESPLFQTFVFDEGRVDEVININTLGQLTINKEPKSGKNEERDRNDGMVSQNENLTRLRQNLTTCFNVSELQTLCFDLGVDYENLPSRGKDDLTRELVMYCQRHNLLPHLVDKCRALRPQVQSWQ